MFELTLHPKIPSSAVVEEDPKAPYYNYEELQKPKVISPSGLEKGIFEVMEKGIRIEIEEENRFMDQYHNYMPPGSFNSPVWVLLHFFTNNEHARQTLHMPWARTSSAMRREENMAYIQHPIQQPILAKAGISDGRQYRIVIPAEDFPDERIPLEEMKNHPQTMEAIFLNNSDFFEEFMKASEFVKGVRTPPSGHVLKDPFEKRFYLEEKLKHAYSRNFSFGGFNFALYNFGIAAHGRHPYRYDYPNPHTGMSQDTNVYCVRLMNFPD